MRCLTVRFVLGSWPAAAADRPVETMPFVDLERYPGKRYEIGRLPNRFQRDCIGATAEYSLRGDGTVGVVNTCYREDGSTRAVEGAAESRDDSSSWTSSGGVTEQRAMVLDEFYEGRAR